MFSTGPPGVGKTLTAESVAIRANKPLFAVGVTDVGVDPEKVQVNLERMFELAGTWEAVLLMQVDYPTPELTCTHTTIQRRSGCVLRFKGVQRWSN